MRTEDGSLRPQRPPSELLRDARVRLIRWAPAEDANEPAYQLSENQSYEEIAAARQVDESEDTSEDDGSRSTGSVPPSSSGLCPHRQLVVEDVSEPSPLSATEVVKQVAMSIVVTVVCRNSVLG